ncbi:TNF receptor-associated factor family protein DDB_G0290931-like [Notothenia coriiceps]|uniref:TNF receptor-associated factor family protein DDB_G0290931-like n=1 Tax=Notothenia coriiceps TaxID=8208 RepID=A0A6I9PTC4_9TELE|nr:PREDICTED: TNF receptor-associated factor family protein DDB_G0290931-like [Notothenia coriiceps]
MNVTSFYASSRKKRVELALRVDVSEDELEISSDEDELQAHLQGEYERDENYEPENEDGDENEDQEEDEDMDQDENYEPENENADENEDQVEDQDEDQEEAEDMNQDEDSEGESAVTALFRAAAEASPRHVLQMLASDGHRMNISPKMQANDPESVYRLELVAADHDNDYDNDCFSAGVGMPQELDSMEDRLQHLESRVMEEVGGELLCDLKKQVESFKKKLESVEHLSWMGLFKEHGHQELSQKPKGLELSEHEERLQVRRKYLNMSSLQVTEEVREHLKTPIFDNW